MVTSIIFSSYLNVKISKTTCSAWNNRRSLVTVGHDFMCDPQDSSLWLVGFQISIVHHIQKTGTNCEWPTGSADCRTRRPAMAEYLFQALTWRKLFPLQWRFQVGCGNLLFIGCCLPFSQSSRALAYDYFWQKGRFCPKSTNEI